MSPNDLLPEQLAGRLSDDSLAIFLFHGVIDRQRHRVRNYTGKHLEVDLFARVIQRLHKTGRALTMDEVLYYFSRGREVPPRSFAVTFDDGFENNLSVAAPVLADYGVPFMIYVTTRFIQENGMSWIDRIEYAVEESPEQKIKVPWADEPRVLDGSASRISFLQGVRQYVKNSPDCRADDFADELCALLGRPDIKSSDDPLDLKLTWDQIRAARDTDLIGIGGHSHTHAILSYLDPEELAGELDLSLELLRTRGGVTADHYSYPEGLAHCYSQKVITALKQRGIRCCPTAMDGVNAPGTDPFHLLRIQVAPPAAGV